MRLNTLPPQPEVLTHEGGHAVRQSALEELTRSVATCLLWERSYYEAGSTIAERIAELSKQVTFAELAALAVRARNDWKLRHVPLFLIAQMARRRSLFGNPIGGIGIISRTMAEVIQRPDELSEFLAIYWKDGRCPLSAQVKLGLAMAFQKFNKYSLSKWDREAPVRLRDVLFLCHAKPKDKEQAALWKLLVEKNLPPADTWEVALSAGKDKKKTWERLIREKHLGYMATLMNLRNMAVAGVDHALVSDRILEGAAKSKALPFRFLTAMKHAPTYGPVLSQALMLALGGFRTLPGKTVVLIDVSGSMDDKLSEKGETTRLDAATALAMMARHVFPGCELTTFSNLLAAVKVESTEPTVEVLAKAIASSQDHGGTHLANALTALRRQRPAIDRLLIITDEQTHDGIAEPWAQYSYIMNVAPYAHGLDRGRWSRIYGFSERLFDWISLEETGRLLSDAPDEEAA